MVRMPRSARPAATRSPMRLMNLTGVESESGTELMVAAGGCDGGRGGSAQDGDGCSGAGWARR